MGIAFSLFARRMCRFMLQMGRLFQVLWARMGCWSKARMFMSRRILGLRSNSDPSTTTRLAALPGSIVPRASDSPSRRAGVVVSAARASSSSSPCSIALCSAAGKSPVFFSRCVVRATVTPASTRRRAWQGPRRRRARPSDLPDWLEDSGTS